MRLKTLGMFAVLALFGCASTQSAPQSTVSGMEPAPERAEPVTQAFAPEAPAMDNVANVPVVQPELAAQEPEVQPEVAAQAPEVQPEVLPQRVAQKATVLPKTAASAAGSPPEMIALNFDNADIYEVINALSDFLGVNFIIDQRVKGRVNIHTAGEIDKSRLLPIMETIFEMNNIAMVEYGDFYKIVPIKDAKHQVVDISIGRELAYVSSYDRQMIQIVPLQYVRAKEVEGLVKHFLGPGGDVFEYGRGNLVVIIERAATIRKMLRMVKAIDIDLFAHNQVRFFKIENANAQDVAAELEEVFTSIGIENTPEKGLGIKFVPVERIGGVLAISSVPGVFERVEHWIEVLDTFDDTASEQVFIYFVENGKAEEIGEVLKEVYASSSGSVSRNRRDVQSRTRKDSRSKSTKRSSRNDESSAMLEGDVIIVIDIPTNSVIVRAIPRDYEIIKRTMVALDRIPRQVLIEVLIAEVKLKGDTAFGVEWSLFSEDKSLGAYDGDTRFGVRGSDLATTGFSYIFDGDRLNVFLQAQASQNKLNILSSPHILAVDNKEARIEVGDEVPIVTSEYIPLDLDSSDSSTSRSVEYRSTGIILTVTPRINERGLVAMDVSQEVSKVDDTVNYGVDSPVISNRKAQTSLVVQDGQTIIIGGLIVDAGGDKQSGVPFLSEIPLIGRLFGTTGTKNEKLELVLLITPHVITNFEEVDLITDEFQSKLNSITKLINKSDDYWDAYKMEDAVTP
jgi:general secretion pathway protein D